MSFRSGRQIKIAVKQPVTPQIAEANKVDPPQKLNEVKKEEKKVGEVKPKIVIVPKASVARQNTLLSSWRNGDGDDNHNHHKDDDCGCDKKHHHKDDDCGCDKKHHHKDDYCGCDKKRRHERKSCGENKGDCAVKCCEKIAFIGNADSTIPVSSRFGTLAQTEAYIKELRNRYFPAKDLVFRYVPFIADPFPLGGSDEEIAAWYADWRFALEDLVNAVDNLVSQGFTYIGIPGDFGTLVFLAGDLIRSHPLHGGVAVDVAYPGVTFMIAGTFEDITPYSNVWDFSDSVTNSTTVSFTSFIADAGLDPLSPASNVAVKLIYDAKPDPANIGGFLPINFGIESVLQDALNSLASLPGVTVVEQLPLVRGTGESTGEYDQDDIQSVAQQICANSRDHQLVIVTPIIRSANSDAFVEAVNTYDDASAACDGVVSNPPFFSTAYANVTNYFLNIGNTIPLTDPNGSAGIEQSSGFTVANGVPSSIQVGLGLPCDFFTYETQINATFNPTYFLEYVWAANCQRVPADVTGIPLRFHLSNPRTFVSQWLVNFVTPAGSAPNGPDFIQNPESALFPNPEWCADGGSFGF